MHLLDLPNELLLLISGCLSTKDLASFFRANRQLAGLLQSMLYKHATEDRFGITAFMWAASKGHEPLVRLLLERGVARVEERDSEGLTALHRAASEGHIGIIKLLLEHGVDIHARTYDFATVLHWAVPSRSEDVMRLVIKSGLSGEEINFQSFKESITAGSQRYRGTALHWATVGGYENMVRILLEEGADVSLKDTVGRVAFSWAVEFGYGELCRILLTGGLDLDERDNYGSTIRELAESGGNKDIIKLLEVYKR